jgi:hypothetical protein
LPFGANAERPQLSGELRGSLFGQLGPLPLVLGPLPLVIGPLPFFFGPFGPSRDDHALCVAPP